MREEKVCDSSKCFYLVLHLSEWREHVRSNYKLASSLNHKYVTALEMLVRVTKRSSLFAAERKVD